MTTVQPVACAPWCVDTDRVLCGRGECCHWSPEAGPEAGVIPLAIESAPIRQPDRKLGDEAVYVVMARNFDPEFQLAPNGADHHTVTVVREGAKRSEFEMTPGEARELARRLLVACDLADEDAGRVGIVSAPIVPPSMPPCPAWCTSHDRERPAWDVVTPHTRGVEAMAWCCTTSTVHTVDIHVQRVADWSTGDDAVNIAPAQVSVESGASEMSASEADEVAAAILNATTLARS